MRFTRRTAVMATSGALFLIVGVLAAGPALAGAPSQGSAVVGVTKH